MNLEVSKSLKAMANPYDSEARMQGGIDFHWDHAYYNEHYYMYYGIVPVLVLFLPFLLITGQTLTTYHATQIFTFFFIVGVFSLLYYLRRRFIKGMPTTVYCLLSTGMAMASVWYCVDAPALYCTAISSPYICIRIYGGFCKIHS